MKMVLAGAASSGPLKMRLAVKHGGLPIAVCEVPCPWGRCPKGRLQLRKNAEFFLDGAPLADLGDGPKEFAALIEKDTCFVVAKDVRAGEHELEVRAKSSSGNDYVAMSHVLFF